MKEYNDQQIIDSWNTNAKPWIIAIQDDEIESRLFVTNKAIIDAIVGKNPKSLLDVGCGEGWLVRKLENEGVTSLGIDVVPELIDFAQKEGPGRFKVVSYERLSYETIKETFDVVVCNFSLLGKESVIGIFEKVSLLLNEGGSFIVQTIHPVISCGDRNYEDAWREGSWEGFSDKFSNPAPWYFRTLESWKSLFLDNGFSIDEIVEPLNKETQVPISIIFIGVKNG